MYTFLILKVILAAFSVFSQFYWTIETTTGKIPHINLIFKQRDDTNDLSKMTWLSFFINLKAKSIFQEFL